MAHSFAIPAFSRSAAAARAKLLLPRTITKTAKTA